MSPHCVYWQVGCYASGVESSGYATAVLVAKLLGHLLSNYGYGRLSGWEVDGTGTGSH